MKKEIRILGIDDSSFDKKAVKSKVLVIGVIFRGGSFMDGVVSCEVEKDGDDATLRLIEMINNCKFRTHLRVIMLDGIALGGFNVIDIEDLYAKTKIPVIVVIRKKPDIGLIKTTLEQLGMKDKVKLIEKAGKVYKCNNIYAQCKGITIEKVKEIIELSLTHGNIPEPVRVAHLIGAGIVKGESKGRA